MEKKNLKIWIAVAIVVIIVIGFFVFTNKKPGSPVATATPTASPTPEPSSLQDINSKDIGVGSVSISYADALIKYADRRIQLDKNCQATPNNVTYKDNTGIMIDNRSAQARIVINTKTLQQF